MFDNNKKALPLILVSSIHRSLSFWWVGLRSATKGHICPSIDLVCKVEKTALEKSSIFVRRSTFQVNFHGFMQKRPRHCKLFLPTGEFGHNTDRQWPVTVPWVLSTIFVTNKQTNKYPSPHSCTYFCPCTRTCTSMFKYIYLILLNLPTV